MYIAIVLMEESKDKLKEKYRVPWGWEDIYHHVTIVMGNKMNDFPFSIGEKVEFEATEYGVCYGFDLPIKKRPKKAELDTHLATAVKVKLPEGKYVKNENPHVTLQVNRQAGGKPFFSNHITEWKPINPIQLEGVVTLCK